MKKNILAVVGMASMLAASCGTLGTGVSNGTTGSSTGNVLGSVIGAMSNGEAIGNVLSSVIGLNQLSQSQLIGTWRYNGPGCAFTSDNLLAKAGGEVAATQIEQKLEQQYAKLGFSSSNTYITFNQDGTFASKIGGKSFSGNYTYDAGTGALNLKGLQRATTDVINHNQIVRVCQLTQLCHFRLPRKTYNGKVACMYF